MTGLVWNKDEAAASRKVSFSLRWVERTMCQPLFIS